MLGPQREQPESVCSDARFCFACNQLLLGVTLGRCPECGRPFDPQNPATTRAAPRRSLGEIVFRALPAVNLAWALALVLVVVACFTAATGMLLMLLLGVMLLPFAVVTVVLSLWPAELSPRCRTLGVLCPLARLVTVYTYWPFFLSFQIHRPLYERAAANVQLTGSQGSGWVGVFHHRKAMLYGPNIGFQVRPAVQPAACTSSKPTRHTRSSGPTPTWRCPWAAAGTTCGRTDGPP